MYFKNMIISYFLSKIKMNSDFNFMGHIVLFLTKYSHEQIFMSIK